ncbi:hypothetical protein E2562_039402 [Oryza meyeriana var. granulata]|uniref:Uncharacterized protein n=1 Tax=Oryza meyeriana var. granulata TaxID=110450 RepID=A0A6G1FGZ1_9ORYZ|nr:hypothetical protein E2562_039402 [Oryza meyeriana var. granulata]
MCTKIGLISAVHSPWIILANLVHDKPLPSPVDAGSPQAFRFLAPLSAPAFAFLVVAAVAATAFFRWNL